MVLCLSCWPFRIPLLLGTNLGTFWWRPPGNPHGYVVCRRVLQIPPSPPQHVERRPFPGRFSFLPWFLPPLVMDSTVIRRKPRHPAGARRGRGRSCCNSFPLQKHDVLRQILQFSVDLIAGKCTQRAERRFQYFQPGMSEGVCVPAHSTPRCLRPSGGGDTPFNHVCNPSVQALAARFGCHGCAGVQIRRKAKAKLP